MRKIIGLLHKFNDAMDKEKIRENQQLDLEKKVAEENRQINKKIDSLDRFPGNLQDYSSLKEGTYEIIDVNSPNKAIEVDVCISDPWYGRSKQQNEYLMGLVNEGCTGFIYYQSRLTWLYGSTSNIFLGVPVRRKRDEK